jgi:hypothetical protein
MTKYRYVRWGRKGLQKPSPRDTGPPIVRTILQPIGTRDEGLGAMLEGRV